MTYNRRKCFMDFKFKFIKMSEFYSWWWGKRFYTSSQIRKMQKQMKKSYKKADKIKKIMEKKHEKEVVEAEKLLEEIDFS